MPITQTSWLTNLTEQDLTENLSSVVSNISEAIRNNNNEIDDLVENQLTSVKNAIAAISDEIAGLSSSMPTSLIGSASDPYGTATTGTVMGKLNYLIYLIAPTPSTFNYSSAGTFNNITIPTGVKFVSITACGGSGGGRVGTFFNFYQGYFRPYNASHTNRLGNLYGKNLSETYSDSFHYNVNFYYYNANSYNMQNANNFYNDCTKFNYNAYGRRVNFLHSGTYNYWQNFSGACYGTSNIQHCRKNIYKITSIAKNVTTAGGNAGITATVSSQSLNVAPAEVLTVVVGAGGGNSAAGGASSVTGTNGTKSFSGAAAGAAGNTVTYSNWTTTFNAKVTNLSGSYNKTGGTNVFQGASGSTNLYASNVITAATEITQTITGSAGKTSTANSLGKKGGNGGTGAAGTIVYYVNGMFSTRTNMAGGAGGTGGSGYVRVAW